MYGKTIFNFLNCKIENDPKKLWNNKELPSLWLYNLHYFNDLKCLDAVKRKEQLTELVLAWVDDNPPYCGVGWEPYPL